MEYTLAVLRCSQLGHWNSVISKSLSIVSFYRIFDYVQQSPVALIRSLKFVKCQCCCTEAGVRMLRFFSARSEILCSVCWWTGSACSVYIINCITSEGFTTWDVLTNIVSVDLIKRLLFKPDWLLTQSQFQELGLREVKALFYLHLFTLSLPFLPFPSLHFSYAPYF